MSYLLCCALDMKKIYKRERYLSKIRGFYHDTDIIKVITGVRRCGKSTILQMIKDELVHDGIGKDNIIFLDLDKRPYTNITKPDQLDTLIGSHIEDIDGTVYLFIDEIQNVKDFETVINGYRNEGNISIFITGSNSYLLSGELITKLTGRYVSFEIYTLTFDEYIEMKKFYNIEVSDDLTHELDEYIIAGGFPRALFYENIEDKRTYIENTINEIIKKDVRRRIKIKNVSSFSAVQTYIMNNFGATTSLTNILEDLKKNGMNIKRETLNRYIQILIDAKVIYECKRFDLKSRRSLKGETKYYLSDLSFYFIRNTDNRINYGPALENIVYLYLRSLGANVSVGKIGNLECDFTVRKGSSDYSYIQVAMTIADRNTEDREYRPLESIKDNYPKYILTRNDLIQKRNGIIHLNIPEAFIDHLL